MQGSAKNASPKVEFDRFAGDYYAIHARNIRFSGERPEFFHEQKVAYLAAVLRRTRQTCGVVVDLGCGIGNSSPYFRKYIPERTIIGLDSSKRCLGIARAHNPGAGGFIACDAERIPLADQTAGVVFSAGVFHHIHPTHHLDVLMEVKRVLKSGGLFLVVEHNPLNPYTRSAVAACPFDQDALLVSPWLFCRRLEETGFSHLRLRFLTFFPWFVRWLRPAERYLAWLPLGAQYVVSASFEKPGAPGGAHWPGP